MTTRRWRRPGVLAIGLTLFGVAAFGTLGFWQLDRAGQKQLLLAAYANAASAPFEIFASVRSHVDSQHYPHVHIAGRFDAAHGYLLDEQVREGRLGVHAIGVFLPDGDEHALLVDRGWIAWDHAPDTLPQLPPLPAGATALQGIYAAYPGGGLKIGGNALATQAAWPKLTLRLDPVDLASDLGRPLLPGLLLLDADGGSGFVREWTPNVMPPQRHLAYAVQWFALALAVLVTFIVLHWRKPVWDRPALVQSGKVNK